MDTMGIIMKKVEELVRRKEGKPDYLGLPFSIVTKF